MATLKSPSNIPHELQEKKRWLKVRSRRWLLLLATGGLMLAWLLALLSYSPWDAAFSTAGDGAPLRNWLGFYGASLADLSYYFFGFSVWLLFLACVRLWLAALWELTHGRLRALPEKNTPSAAAAAASRWWPVARFHLGLWLMVGGACALEWSRLHRLDPDLPGTSGGVMGLLLGATGEQYLGFNGTALAGVACVVLGFAWAFRFSWLGFAETLGQWVYARVQAWRNRREERRDLAAGAQAAHEREAQLQAQAQAAQAQQPPAPGATAAAALAPSSAAAPHSVKAQPPVLSDIYQEAAAPIATPASVAASMSPASRACL